MKTAIICFTINGYITAKRVRDALSCFGDEAELFTKSRFLDEEDAVCVDIPLRDWTFRMFSEKDAIIFIGAAGICVRAVSPFLQDKRYDPAVIVIDEKGRFCIPLLSGHIGGANELALKTAGAIEALPVITTATDINGLFAVDVFADRNSLKISDMALAKEVSARLLAGGKVGFTSELPFKGSLPDGLVYIPLKTDDLQNPDPENVCDIPDQGIYIGIFMDKSPYKETLFLVPQILFAGIGCKRGKTYEEINALYDMVTEEEHINPLSLGGAASVDLKADEQGIKDFCRKKYIPFNTYSAEELLSVEGKFTASEFVKSVTSVDNVCERAAVRMSGGKLVCPKSAREGVTLALAVKYREIRFE